MLDVTRDRVERAVLVLGKDGISDGEIEAEMLELAGEPMLARRLIDWPPEAFGLALAPHMAAMRLPTRFSARTAGGEWLQFEFEAEPVFAHALAIAMWMYHEGRRGVFGNVARRSSTLDAINRALNAGDSLEGATLAGPALIGIPAEVYLASDARS